LFLRIGLREANVTSGPDTEQARSVYLASCLGIAEDIGRGHPQAWPKGIDALNNKADLLKRIFNAPPPAGDALQARARAAGLQPPPG
jgi:hypothetical protein